MDAKELARLIDGEGSICSCMQGTKNVTPYPRVALAMADLVYPQALYDTYGGYLYFRKQPNPNARGLWRWYIGSFHIKPLLLLILPELQIKQAQAEAALLMLTTIPVKGKHPTDKQLVLRWTLHELICSLNKRGPSKRPSHEEVSEVLTRLKELPHV